jgi:hypothetical protein
MGMSDSVSCVFRTTVVKAGSRFGHVAALLLLVPALVLPTAAAAVPFVPDATSQLVVNASGQIVISNVVGTNSIGADPPEVVTARGTFDTGASATTLGVSPTTVIAPTTITGLGVASVGGSARATAASPAQSGEGAAATASAHLIYFVGVVPLVPLPPGAPPVDIDVGFTLLGSAHGEGGGGFGFAQINVGIGINGAFTGGAFTQSMLAGELFDTRTLSLDLSDGFEDLLRIDLQASGAVSVGASFNLPTAVPGESSGFFTAFADPDFRIDPSYPFRDSLQLVFSPNLAPARVPAPGTLWLVALGLLGVGWLAARRTRTAHDALLAPRARLSP